MSLQQLHNIELEEQKRHTRVISLLWFTIGFCVGATIILLLF